MLELNTKKGRIELGHSGERNAAAVQFDVSEFRRLYGDGTAQLFHRRAGDAAAYPAAVTMEGDTVRWQLSPADTAQEGQGEAQLHWIVDGTLAKTDIFPTFVLESLEAGGETPTDPAAPWYQALSAQIAAMGSASPEQIQRVVEQYLEAHPVEGVKGDRGEKGDPGEPGTDGRDGVDGVSPTVTVEPVQGGHTVTITDAEGEHRFEVPDGVGAQPDYELLVDMTLDIPANIVTNVDDLAGYSGFIVFAQIPKPEESIGNVHIMFGGSNLVPYVYSGATQTTYSVGFITRIAGRAFASLKWTGSAASLESWSTASAVGKLRFETIETNAIEMKGTVWQSALPAGTILRVWGKKS